MIPTYNVTVNQKKALDFIVSYIKAQGLSPSRAEVAEAVGCTTENVGGILAALEAKGLITREKHKHRSITVPPEILNPKEEPKP